MRGKVQSIWSIDNSGEILNNMIYIKGRNTVY